MKENRTENRIFNYDKSNYEFNESKDCVIFMYNF